jgi:4-amino-4-deoxy-L-arabinose transferase-like glycosyltransferase
MVDDGDRRVRAFLSSRSGGALGLLALLCALAFLLVLGLGREPPGRISETRCMLVVGKMIETSDWLVPRLGDMPRLQKPPLFYWLSAVVAVATGDVEPEITLPVAVHAVTVRSVSVTACLALAVLVAWWGRSALGPGMGLTAAGAFALMYQVIASGRRGDAEMLLALLSTAALFSFDRLDATRRRALLPCFAVFAGLAILTKATAVLLTVVLPILVYLALRRELRALRDPGVIASCAGAVAIGLSWYVALILLVPGAGETLLHTLILPLGGQGGRGDSTHFRAFWWYFSVLPARTPPASLLLPLVVWRLWQTRLYRDDPRRRLAALAFLVPFVAFSLLPQKQKHYTLSMVPGLALCTADALAAALRALGARVTLPLRALGLPLALAGAAGAVLLALFQHWVVDSRSAVELALLPLALFTLAAAGALLGWPAAFGASWTLGALLALGIMRGDVSLTTRELATGGFLQLEIDDKERIAALVRERPWFARLFLLDSAIAGNGDDDEDDD